MMRTKIFIVNCLILFSGSILFGQEKIGVHSLYYFVNPDYDPNSTVDTLYWELIPECLYKKDSIHLNYHDTLNNVICESYFGNHQCKFIMENDEWKYIIDKYSSHSEEENWHCVDSLVFISFDSCVLYRKDSQSHSEGYQIERIITFDENKMTEREGITFAYIYFENESNVLFDSANHYLTEYHFVNGRLSKCQWGEILNGKRNRFTTIEYDYFSFEGRFHVVGMNEENYMHFLQIISLNNHSFNTQISKRTFFEIQTVHLGGHSLLTYILLLLHFPELMEKVE